MIKEFELTDEQLERLLNASKPVPYMIMGGHPPTPPRERINAIWESYGESMGFKFLSVKAVDGKDQHFFTAEEL